MISPGPAAARVPFPVGGLLFDLDNTLHDRDKAFDRWARAFAAETLELRDRAEREEAVAHLVAIDEGGDAAKRAVFEAVRARHPGVRLGAEEMIALFYAQRLEHMALDEDAARLLDALLGAGIPYGIVTNGPAEQQDKLCRLGLDRLTPCIFVSGVFGADKPDPAIFLAAAQRLGVPAAKVLFVGDHPEKDVAGARSAGMRTAWLSRGRDWPEREYPERPDLILDSLRELQQQLGLEPPPTR